MDFGAVADNQTDIGPALMKAFGCAQKAITTRASDTVILVPAGNYKLASKVVFDKSKFITVTVLGHLYMPYDPKCYSVNSCKTTWYCSRIAATSFSPISYVAKPLIFEHCDFASTAQFVRRPALPIRIHDFEIHSANIGATDGIDVAGSDITPPYSNLGKLNCRMSSIDHFVRYVHDVLVENGDECVTAKSPIVGLKVENLQCIGGTGCGIGSMGASAKNYQVENLNYRNVTVNNAANGVNIFVNFSTSSEVITDVAYPIKLDYTWGATLKPQFTRRNKRSEEIQSWSDITFNNFVGTGSKYRAPVTLNCPTHSPCSGLKFNNVQITGSTKASIITNACGTVDAISRKTIPNLTAC
ncbi:family 28 glycoside hydrolase [Melampsora larici-populina 98AG31]|uniref:Family 28 glycoside hydrolase n=1 Tax=Melampsora larici-populina (strain 98AG31 / pathotype 3-4-7) TaxID=747676 RepID=F4R4Y6_MELLP|nr:family 28 glycoside hydrolase [Melampsora larici-populina 98AG31]EGG12884.1 family 28 glycoside hydrolase [Melampsora larici-populina 98AG31]